MRARILLAIPDREQLGAASALVDESTEIELAGTATIRRRIVAVERLGSRPTSPFLDSLWGLLDRIPEIIPRALPIVPR